MDIFELLEKINIHKEDMNLIGIYFFIPLLITIFSSYTAEENNIYFMIGRFIGAFILFFPTVYLLKAFRDKNKKKAQTDS